MNSSNPTRRRRRRSSASRRSLVLAALVLSALSAHVRPARAQILNTLRGWSGEEPGWSGDVEARFALSEGNTEYLELSAGGSVQLLAGRHRVRGLVSETLRRADGEEIAENFIVHLRHNYRLTGPLHTLLFVQNQYNPFRRLERRTLLGAGLRWDLARAETWNAALGAAYMHEAEVLTDDPTGGTERDHRLSFLASLMGRVTDVVRADVAAFYQPLASDFGNSRAYAAGSMRVDLVGELDLLVALTLDHDSDPAEGVEETDLTLGTGLVLSF